MKRKIGTAIWNTAEFLRIDLGRFAPTVFGWMVGSKGKRRLESPFDYDPDKPWPLRYTVKKEDNTKPE